MRDNRRRRDAERERFLREVHELPIYLPRVPLADLAPVAIDCRNRFLEASEGGPRLIRGHVRQETLDRLIVNYLRHQVTSFEDVVEQSGDYRLEGEAYRILRARVLEKIAETYPELAEECQRQERISENSGIDADLA